MFVAIPLECWIEVCKFIDSWDTFKNLMKAIYCENKEFAISLYKIISWDIIKYFKRIKLINNLIDNPMNFINNRENYLNFKDKYINQLVLSNKYSNVNYIKNMVFIERYRHFILSKIKSDKFKNVVKNLTKIVDNFSDDIENYYTYYNIKIPINDIVMCICNPNHKEYLLPLQYQFL